MKDTIRDYYGNVEGYFKKDFSPIEKGVIALVIFLIGMTVGIVIGMMGKKKAVLDEEIELEVPDFDNVQIPEKATENVLDEAELFQDELEDITAPAGEKKAFWRFKK